MIFTQDMMKNNQDIKSIKKVSDRFKAIKEKWKNMEPKEHDYYKNEEKKKKQTIAEEMEKMIQNGESATSEFNIDDLFNHK